MRERSATLGSDPKFRKPGLDLEISAFFRRFRARFGAFPFWFGAAEGCVRLLFQPPALPALPFGPHRPHGACRRGPTRSDAFLNYIVLACRLLSFLRRS